MEIKLILNPEEAKRAGLPEIIVDYSAFIQGLEDKNLDETEDWVILKALARHLRLPLEFFSGYQIERQPALIKVNK